MTITHTAKRILFILRRRWRWYEGNSWKSFAKLAKEIHRSAEDTRAGIRELEELGAVYYSWMCNEDMQPCGSGYFLTAKWDE